MPMTVPTGSSAKATAASAAVLSSLSISPFCVSCMLWCGGFTVQQVSAAPAGRPLTEPCRQPSHSSLDLFSPCAIASQTPVSGSNEFPTMLVRTREKIADPSQDCLTETSYRTGQTCCVCK